MPCALWRVMRLRAILPKLREPGMSLSPCNLIRNPAQVGESAKKHFLRNALKTGEDQYQPCLKSIRAYYGTQRQAECGNVQRWNV